MEDHQAAVTDPLKTETPTGADGKSMIGCRVGPYRIEREIGRGGMGTVYEAWRTDGEFHILSRLLRWRWGNHDKAFYYLEKSFAERDNWLLWFATEPKLDPLRRDPRFNSIQILFDLFGVEMVQPSFFQLT